MLASPEVEAGNARPWMPGLAGTADFGRFGHRFQPIVLHDCAIDGEVVDGEDIGALELDEQEHLGGPSANTPDLEKPFNDGFIIHIFKHMVAEVARSEVLGKAAKCCHLLTRLSCGTHLLVAEGEYLGSIRERAGWRERGEAPENRAGSPPAKLLVRNRSAERHEWIFGGRADLSRTVALDQVGEHGVGGAEVCLGGFDVDRVRHNSIIRVAGARVPLAHGSIIVPTAAHGRPVLSQR